jgi:hypothetical protein
MRLTIKNPEKILGKYGNHNIILYIEYPNRYVFYVENWKDPNSVEQVVVSRIGVTDFYGDTVFSIGDGRRYVTLDWVSDMVNAITTIINEYKDLVNA